MNSNAEFRVIRSDGIRSKLTTAARIIEMYKAGQIGEDSTVRQEGNALSIPVGVFVDLQSVEATPANKLRHTTFVPADRSTKPTAENADKPFTPYDKALTSSSKSWRQDDEHCGFFSGVLHFLTFRGMTIPREDRGQTASYLSTQIRWLERYVKFLHFFNVLFVWLILAAIALVGLGSIVAVYQSVQNGGLLNGMRVALDMSLFHLFNGIWMLLAFFILMVLEALLRLVPACLRHWMAINEDTKPL